MPDISEVQTLPVEQCRFKSVHFSNKSPKIEQVNYWNCVYNIYNSNNSENSPGRTGVRFGNARGEGVKEKFPQNKRNRIFPTEIGKRSGFGNSEF